MSCLFSLIVRRIDMRSGDVSQDKDNREISSLNPVPGLRSHGTRPQNRRALPGLFYLQCLKDNAGKTAVYWLILFIMDSTPSWRCVRSSFFTFYISKISIYTILIYYVIPGLPLPMMLSIRPRDKNLVLIKLRNRNRGPVMTVGVLLFRRAAMASFTITSG